MQKQKITGMLALMLILISLVSATCSQMYTNKYGTAIANVQICYESKITSSSYFLAGDNIKVSCNSGSSLYYSNSLIDCDDEGCSGNRNGESINYLLQKSDEGKKLYFLCYNIDQSDEYYSYNYVHVNYNIPATLRECSISKCSGTTFIDCINGKYETKGLVEGKCGVKCSSIGKEICDGKSLEVCNSFYQLESKGKTIGSCGYGYWDVIVDFFNKIFGSSTGSLSEDSKVITVKTGEGKR